MFSVICNLIVLLSFTAVFCNAREAGENFTELSPTTRTPGVLFVDLYTLQTGADYREITTKQRLRTTTTSPTQRPRRQGLSSRFVVSPESGEIEQRLAGVFRNSAAFGKSYPERRTSVPGTTEEATVEVPGQSTGKVNGTVAGEGSANKVAEDTSPDESVPGQVVRKEVSSQRVGPGEEFPKELIPGEVVAGEVVPGEAVAGEVFDGDHAHGYNFPGEALARAAVSEDLPGESFHTGVVPGQWIVAETIPGEVTLRDVAVTGETPGESSAPSYSTAPYAPPEVQVSSTFVPYVQEILTSTAKEVSRVPASPQSKKPRKPTFDEADALFIPDIDVVSTLQPNQTWFHKLFDFSEVFQRINRNPRTSHKVPITGEFPVTTPGEVVQTTSTTISQLLSETTTMLDLPEHDYDQVDSNTTSESEMKDDIPISTTEDDEEIDQAELTTSTEATEVGTTINVITTTRSAKKETGSSAASRVSSANTVPFFADSPTLRFFQENCAAIVGGIVGLVLVIVGCYVVCQRRYRSGRMTVCRSTIDWQISDLKPRRQPLLFSPTMETPLTSVEVVPDYGSPECIVQPRRLTTFIPTPPPLPKLH